MKLIFFDTETTSINPGSICQLSYIIVDQSTKPASTTGKNFFFTVDEMDPNAEAVHGFSMERLYELSNGMYFEDLCEEFLQDFLSADIVIGHNVNFDIKFLCHELDGLGMDYKPKNIFCTMNYYKNVCKILNPRGEFKNPKLVEVVKFLGIDDSKITECSKKLFGGTGDYHDARFDTAATYLIVTEGIRRGCIPPGYISRIVKGNQL